MNPTDPMTPVRALIEATKDCHRLETVDYSIETAQILYAAIASISQLLSEHDKIVALEAQWRYIANNEFQDKSNKMLLGTCADRLQSIMEGK